MATPSTTFTFPEGAVTLNHEQAAIVRQPPSQNLRILASAGSGKTTTLTARIAWLLTDPAGPRARPDQIVLLTFTHNAATVMRNRLQNLVGARRILCGTFHSLSQQILRDQCPEALTDIYHVDELPLKALDWLATAAGRAWTASLGWIFIDEFQDINDTQYDFIRALHSNDQRQAVTIVGDDAQNIYTWRGSCVDYILNFHKRFPDVTDYQLSTNYRSNGAIVAVANSIMRYIPTLPHKELMTPAPDAPTGDRPEVHYFSRTSEERDWVTEAAARATGSTAILSKFNSVLYSYEAALLRLGVRVRFVQGEDEGYSTGPTTASTDVPIPSQKTVFLSTFHGAKGLEWDNVFLVRMNDEVFPQQKDEDSILQERRLFYVAVTRARKTLTLTYSRHDKSLSRFIREIHRPLLVWRRLPQYELSTLSAAIQPTDVADWIGYLAGEDYRLIKQLGVLPASLTAMSPLLSSASSAATAAATTTTYVTPYWWTEQGLTKEFADFLRAFWHREIAVHRPASGGQWDRTAQRVIWTIKIAGEDAAIFETYKPLFDVLTERFFGSTPRGDAPPQIYYTEILAAIRAEAPGTHFDQDTIIRIIQIIHKMRTMLYNLRFASIALSDLQFAPVRHAPPQESRCDLIHAWRAYTNGHPLTLPALPADELNSIYRIGLCESLAAGRSGVLYAFPGEREWARCRDFLRVLRAQAAAIATGPTQPILCRVSAEIAPGVQATAEMLVGTTAWFFVPGDNPLDLQRLDTALEILLTVHALRIAGHTVTDVCLFQMLSGATTMWDLRGWRAPAAALLTAFIQARVSHVTA
jgi:hypothetical protein